MVKKGSRKRETRTSDNVYKRNFISFPGCHFGSNIINKNTRKVLHNFSQLQS